MSGVFFNLFLFDFATQFIVYKKKNVSRDTYLSDYIQESDNNTTALIINYNTYIHTYIYLDNTIYTLIQISMFAR